MGAQQVIDYNDIIYSYLKTPQGIFLARMLYPLLMGELLKVMVFLCTRIYKKENTYTTELSGYLGNIIAGVFMMLAFPNGYSFAQILLLGTGYAGVAFILHIFLIRVIGGQMQSRFKLKSNPFVYGGVKE